MTDSFRRAIDAYLKRRGVTPATTETAHDWTGTKPDTWESRMAARAAARQPQPEPPEPGETPEDCSLCHEWDTIARVWRMICGAQPSARLAGDERTAVQRCSYGHQHHAEDVWLA